MVFSKAGHFRVLRLIYRFDHSIHVKERNRVTLKKTLINILMAIVTTIIFAAEVSASTVTSEMPQETTISEGIDRLIIPAASINTPIYDVDGKGGQYVQSVVDAEESAAWFHYGGTVIVADHNGQGFMRIAQAIPGESVALVQKDGVLSEYICVNVGVGRNEKTSLHDKDGNKFNTYPEQTMITYTCYNGWQNVYYCVWEPCTEQDNQEGACSYLPCTENF